MYAKHVQWAPHLSLSAPYNNYLKLLRQYISDYKQITIDESEMAESMFVLEKDMNLIEIKNEPEASIYGESNMYREANFFKLTVLGEVFMNAVG